jgi:hypothetical protein
MEGSTEQPADFWMVQGFCEDICLLIPADFLSADLSNRRANSPGKPPYIFYTLCITKKLTTWSDMTCVHISLKSGYRQHVHDEHVYRRRCISSIESAVLGELTFPLVICGLYIMGSSQHCRKKKSMRGFSLSNWRYHAVCLDMLQSWLMPERQAISNLIDQLDETPSHFHKKGLIRSLFIPIPAGPTANLQSTAARTLQEWRFFAQIIPGGINKITKTCQDDHSPEILTIFLKFL